MPRLAHAAVAPRTARFADQATAALINFALSAIIVRVAGVAGLGDFNLPFTIYLGAVALQRAVVGEPILASRELRAVYPGAQQIGLATSALAGGVIIVIGAVSAAPALMAVGIVLPALLMEDLVRYGHFRSERPQRALIMDVIWLVTSLSVLVLPVNTAAAAIFVWGAGALIASVAGWALGERLVWRRGDLASFGRSTKGISGATAVDMTIYLYGWALPVALGLGAVGAVFAGEYRIASTLMSPLGIIASTWTIGTYSRIRASQRREDVPVLRSAVTVLALSLLYAAALVLLHPLLTRLLFGGGVRVDTAIVALVALQIPLFAFEGQLAVWFKLTRSARYIALSRVISSSAMIAFLVGSVVLSQPLLIAGAIGGAATVHSAISLGFYLRRRGAIGMPMESGASASGPFPDPVAEG